MPELLQKVHPGIVWLIDQIALCCPSHSIFHSFFFALNDFPVIVSRISCCSFFNRYILYLEFFQILRLSFEFRSCSSFSDRESIIALGKSLTIQAMQFFDSLFTLYKTLLTFRPFSPILLFSLILMFSMPSQIP